MSACKPRSPSPHLALRTGPPGCSGVIGFVTTGDLVGAPCVPGAALASRGSLPPIACWSEAQGTARTRDWHLKWRAGPVSGD